MSSNIRYRYRTSAPTGPNSYGSYCITTATIDAVTPSPMNDPALELSINYSYITQGGQGALELWQKVRTMTRPPDCYDSHPQSRIRVRTVPRYGTVRMLV